MTVRERMLALSLVEKTAKDPEYAKQIGLSAFVECNDIGKAKESDKKNA